MGLGCQCESGLIATEQGLDVQNIDRTESKKGILQTYSLSTERRVQPLTYRGLQLKFNKAVSGFDLCDDCHGSQRPLHIHFNTWQVCFLAVCIFKQCHVLLRVSFQWNSNCKVMRVMAGKSLDGDHGFPIEHPLAIRKSHVPKLHGPLIELQVHIS